MFGALLISCVKNSVRAMKAAFAVLLLLFQLQPLLGTVACLDLSNRAAQEECRMPDHGLVPERSVSASPGPLTQTCALQTVCAPSPLCIPTPASGLVTVIAPHDGAVLTAATPLLGIPPAPPFHPPRA